MDQKNLVKGPAQGELFPDPCRAISLYIDADNVRVPPTLETLPRELQLQICREMLRSEEPIDLLPCKPYHSGFSFGSLGILRVSKHFSTMALSVMYGDNYFRLVPMYWAIEDKNHKNNDPEDDDLEDDLEDDDLEDDDLEGDDLEDYNLEDDDFEGDDLDYHGVVSVLLVLKRMLVDF